MTWGVHSEIGTLRKVIVHRPELELTRLTPTNAEEPLFDDVIWVKRAKQEHDVLAETLRERGSRSASPSPDRRRPRHPEAHAGRATTCSTSAWSAVARQVGARAPGDRPIPTPSPTP